jgi:hypothetical protein
MQNNCVNILRLEPRNQGSIKEVLNQFLDSNYCLDFHKVIEIPKELKTSMRPLEIACEAPHGDPKTFEKKIRKLEEKIREKNLEDYGFETPEEWAQENWGTDYNCFNFYWDEEKNCALFDTTNTPALHIVAEISQKIKKTLVLFYAEPSSQQYGELKVHPSGECNFKDYTESNTPLSFHNEFPSDYPPKKTQKKTQEGKKAKKRNELRLTDTIGID